MNLQHTLESRRCQSNRIYQLVTGQEIKVGKNTTLVVLHTPGHTEGSICLYDKTRGLLFSGDTLFAGGYGRVDASGSDPAAMKETLKKLMELPPSTEVYPGHGGFTTIGNEKEWIFEMIGENQANNPYPKTCYPPKG